MAARKTTKTQEQKEERFEREVRKVKAERGKQDMKELIALTLESPVNSEDANLAMVNGNYSIQSFKGKNTDVQTRIMIAMSMKAMSGDIKAAEFLMKYGGFEPPKEHQVEVKTPVFINDLEDEDEDAQRRRRHRPDGVPCERPVGAPPEGI